MSSAQRSLIERDDELDGHQDIGNGDLKDTKFSWFVCGCTFFTQIIVLGLLHAFGVFFVEFVREFHTSKGETAWIGSLAYGLSMAFGPVTSCLVKRFGYRIVMMVGAGLCAISVVASSFAKSLSHLFITFSVLYGMGTSMSTGPTMTITPEYFDKYLTIAVGITVSGSSFGTLIMGPLSQILCDSFGWRNVFRTYSALLLVTVVLLSRIKPLNSPPGRAHSVDSLQKAPGTQLIADLKLWKNRVFVIWTIAITLVMFGFYIPYVHLVSYAMDVGVSQDKASLLIMLLGACTAIGRLLFGKIVSIGVLNRLHMHQLSMVITGTGVLLLPLIKSFAGIVAYVITVGLVDGCFVVLLPILTTSLVGIENSVLAWGCLVGCSSVTFTLGPPVAGLLYDNTGSYNIAFHIAGLPIIAGAVILFLIPWAQRSYSSTNVMQIVNEYSVTGSTAVFDAAFNNEDYRSESVNILCSGDRRAVPNTRQEAVSSNRATSTEDLLQSEDKSTSTISIPIIPGRLPMDVEDHLNQLSHNDRIFTEMLKTAYTDGTSEASVDAFGATNPMAIRRPSGSRTDSIHSRNSDLVSDSRQHSQTDSLLDDISIPSFTQEIVSNTSQPFIGSGSAFALSDSQYSTQQGVIDSFSGIQGSVSGIPGSASGIPGSISGISPGKGSNLCSISQTYDDNDPSKQESAFEQVISDQVDMLRETLKSPELDADDISSKVSNVSARSSRAPSPSQYAGTSVSTNNPFTQVPVLELIGPSPCPSSSTRGEPSVFSLLTHKGTEPVQQVSSSVFDHENQLTVKGNNPLVDKPESQDNDTGCQHLQDLFIRPDPEKDFTNDEASVKDLSLEVESNLSQDNDGTASITKPISEIDVFTHLFSDEN